MTSGLAFRAQLVFREQRQIYDYWQSCAGLRQMPSRKDIDPCSMRKYLPQISLIDICDGMKSATVRLAGSRLRDVYGFELTGKCLGDLEWGEKRPYWQAVYRDLLTKGAPQGGTIEGPMCRREHVTLFWLRLPLSQDGENVNMILCHDIAVPSNSAEYSAGQASVGAMAAAG